MDHIKVDKALRLLFVVFVVFLLAYLEQYIHKKNSFLKTVSFKRVARWQSG